MAFGTHFSDAVAGRVFSQTTLATGAALPVYTATAIITTGIGTPVVLNQSNSNILCELVAVDLCYCSGTTALASVGLMMGFCTGIGAATGCSVLSAGTVAVNANLGIFGGSKVISTNVVAVTAGTVTAGTFTAPVAGVPGAGWVRTLFSLNLEASTGTPHGTLVDTYWFNGTALMQPGTICYLAASLATVSLYSATIMWKEVPIR